METKILHKFGIWSSIKNFVRGSYISRDACDSAFASMHRRDGIGDRVHLVFACLAMMSIGMPVSVLEIAVLPLVVFFFVRVINTFPVWVHGFGQPIVLVGLVLAGWMGLSLVWSSDPLAGLEHIGEMRWIAMIGFVYPVIEKRGYLIAALCAGFLVGNLVQVIDGFDGFGNEALGAWVHHEPTRISGWWDPAVSGTILVGVLGFHLSGAAFGSGRGRDVGIVCGLVTMIAILATGTRGAWIGSVVLVGMVVVAKCVADGVRVRWIVGGLVGLIGVGVVVAQVPSVEARVEHARTEITRAMDGDFGSSTGARVSMGAQAVVIGFEHPIKGVGAGGFRDEMVVRTETVYDNHAHPHNELLRWWSELGMIGVGVGVLGVGVVFVGSRYAPRRQIEIRGQTTWEGYAKGATFALAGVCVMSVFDSVLLNTHSAALVGAIAALCPSYIPRLTVDEGGAQGA